MYASGNGNRPKMPVKFRFAEAEISFRSSPSKSSKIRPHLHVFGQADESTKLRTEFSFKVTVSTKLWHGSLCQLTISPCH